MQVKIDPVVSNRPQAATQDAAAKAQDAGAKAPTALSTGVARDEATGYAIEISETLRFEIQLLQEKRASFGAGLEQVRALTERLASAREGFVALQARVAELDGLSSGSEAARAVFDELVTIAEELARVTPFARPDALYEGPLAAESAEQLGDTGTFTGYPVSRRDWVQAPRGDRLATFVEVPLADLPDPASNFNLRLASERLEQFLSGVGSGETTVSGIDASASEALEAIARRGLFGVDFLADVFVRAEARLSFRVESLTTQIAENRAAVESFADPASADAAATATAQAIRDDPAIAQTAQRGVDPERAAALLRDETSGAGTQAATGRPGAELTRDQIEEIAENARAQIARSGGLGRFSF